MADPGQQTRAPGAHGARAGAVAALLALAALRMLLVVAPAPMYGYANNYDFIRVSAWFDLWPLPPAGRETLDPQAQHPSAPLRCYRIDHDVTSYIRYPTAELAFVWLALRANDAWRALTGPRTCELDLRVLGLLRAAILLAAGLAVTVAFFRRSPRAGVVSALILATVLSDPAVVLLFNTLYSEFSTLLFAYLAVAGIVYVAAFARFGIASGLALGAVLLGLAASKTQYAGLALALCAILAFATLVRRDRRTSRRARRATVALAAVASLTGLLLQQRAMSDGGYMWSMRMGAATDAFFGAFLAHHADPDRGVALLGLPERCRPYVGRTWYDEGMQPPPCPEVGTVPRLRLVRLLIDDPGLALRLAARALPLLRPLIVRHYGQVEGESYAQADARWRAGIVSLSVLVEALPTAAFAALLALTVLAAARAVVRLTAAAEGSHDDDLLLPLLVLALTVVEAYSFSSSLVGAGFIDLARHSLLGQLAFATLVPASLLLLRRASGGRQSARG
ncbi:MAG: hypothetical protein AB1689_20375, partial [Thermodesulfobacteriota bacterium]